MNKFLYRIAYLFSVMTPKLNLMEPAQNEMNIKHYTIIVLVKRKIKMCSFSNFPKIHCGECEYYQLINCFV